MVRFCCNVSSYKQDCVWSWFICFCTITRMILTAGFGFALGVLLPVFMDTFEESREKAAWVSSIVIGGGNILGPLTSAFLNRFGLKITTTLGCLMCSLGLALGSFAPSIIILYIAFSVPFTVGTMFVYITSTIIVTHYFTKRRSFALGFVIAGQGLGTMILGPTLQAIADVLDWRNTFRVFAGLLFVASLTGCLLNEKPTSTDHDEHEKSTPKKFKLNVSVLKNRTILALLASFMSLTICRMVPYVHLIKHCDDLGIPGDKSSTLYLFIGIFAAVGRLGGGFLCDFKHIKALRLLQAATFTIGASTMLLTLAKSYAALVVYAITFGLADGVMISTFFVKCFKSVEQSKRASVMGFISVTGAPFFIGSPPLAGLMADKFGNYTAAFLMAGGFGVIASIIPFLLLCVKREPEQLVDQDIEQEVDQVQSEDIEEREPNLKSDSQELTIINRTERPRYIVIMESSV